MPSRENCVLVGSAQDVSGLRRGITYGLGGRLSILDELAETGANFSTRRDSYIPTYIYPFVGSHKQ